MKPISCSLLPPYYKDPGEFNVQHPAFSFIAKQGQAISIWLETRIPKPCALQECDSPRGMHLPAGPEASSAPTDGSQVFHILAQF